MASASTIAALQKMYKTVYMGRDLANQSKRKTPAFDAVQKFDDFDGANLTFPFNYNMPNGVATTLPGAQAAANASGFDNWVMTTRKTLYGVLTIDAQAMRAARKDIGAFLRLRQKETNELMSYMKMVLGGHAFWGDGAGNLAQVTAVAGGPNPITSFTVSQFDVVKIHKNQVLVFNPNRTGNAGTIKASTWRVDTLNRTTGVIGVTRLTGAGAPVDPAANDFVYQNGTYDAFPLGIDAFVPSADPGTGGVPATILGMTRTDDPVIKSGWRVAWQGSIEETIKFLAAIMGQYLDQENSVCWVSRFNWFRLDQELTAQNRKIIDARATQVFGSPALLLITPEGNIPVVSDPYLPNDRGYILEMSQIETHHLDGLIHVADDDGLGAIRQAADDGIEIRLRSWSENIVQRPFNCGRFPIV